MKTGNSAHRFGSTPATLRGVLPTLLVALALGAATPLAATQLPDFSGNWVLDRDASRVNGPGLAGLRSPAPENLFIQQPGRSTVILSSRLPGSIPRTYEFDAQSWVPVIEGEDTEILVTSRVRGLSLVTSGAGRVGGETITVQEVMAIASTGRSLTLRVTTTGPDGVITNTLVYNRAGGR